MDLRGRPRPPVPLQGQLLHVPGDEGEASGDPGRQGRQARQAPARTSSNGCAARPRPARPRTRHVWSVTTRWQNEARNNKKLDFSEIQIPAGPRLGSVVLEAEHLHKAFGDRVLIDDLSFTPAAQRHRRRDRPERRRQVHAVQDHRRSGAADIRRAEDRRHREASATSTRTVRASTRTRTCGRLSPAASTSSRSAGVEVPTRAYVASFGFKGSDQQKLTGVLSGGERNRLNLALTLKQGGNLLLLDEPTNDLDVETLESLENALLGVPRLRRGHLPRPLVPRPHRHAHPGVGGRLTRTRPSGTGSKATSRPTRENRVARLGEDAARPHRLHKKLTRV